MRAPLARSVRLGAALAAALSVIASVSAQPARRAGAVPRPADIFGFEPGADYKLATNEQIVSYFRALDAASDRVVVQEIGKSVEGRPMILAIVSSEANIRNLAKFKTISQRLALARGVDEAAARTMARDGKAIVWIDGGLHATEVAHAQHMPALANWLATSEDAEAQRVRNEVVALLMPVMNPDGLDIVADWYRRNLGTPFETSPVPQLYHHYIGHDNNRDWYMFTQVETQAVARILYHEWFPQIVYNHHQSSPFPGRIWGPPFEDPVNPNLDPLIVSSLNQIGEAMRKRFDEEGKPGYNSGIVFDLWWNGSMRGGPDFHNMLGFLTETALYRYATPHCYDAKEIPETFGERADNLPARTPSTDYTNPWLGGCWRIGDAVDYMLTASRAVLDFSAKLREDYLFNIWRMGSRQIARGERAEGGPFAYVIDLGGATRRDRHGRVPPHVPPRERGDPPGRRRIQRWRQDVSRGNVRHSPAAVSSVRGRSDGGQAVSRSAAVSGRTSRPAVRHDRLRAVAADGRCGRPHQGAVHSSGTCRRHRSSRARDGRRRDDGDVPAGSPCQCQRGRREPLVEDKGARAGGRRQRRR